MRVRVRAYILEHRHICGLGHSGKAHSEVSIEVDVTRQCMCVRVLLNWSALLPVMDAPLRLNPAAAWYSMPASTVTWHPAAAPLTSS